MWKDISTAPKDGTEILATNLYWFARCYWGRPLKPIDAPYGWLKAGEEYPIYPTHWVEIPELPQPPEKQ